MLSVLGFFSPIGMHESKTTTGFILKLLPIIKATERQLKALCKRRDAAYVSDTTPNEKDLRIKKLEREMKKVIDRFNKRYEALIL